jgi:nitric oxide synthase oxygenase domain/subunit
MRTALFSLLFVVPIVQSQVVECPKFYPWPDTQVAEVPYQHKGTGFIAKAKLAGAGMYTGELNGKGEMQGSVGKLRAAGTSTIASRPASRNGWSASTAVAISPGGSSWIRR